MPLVQKRFTQRRIQVFFGILLSGILYAEFEFNADYEPILRQGTPVVFASERIPADPFERLVRNDPLEALSEALRQLDRDSRDYVCTFVKQERLGDKMSPEQEVEVKFRPKPYSVMMHWIRNPGMARRVIYVKGKWVDHKATDPKMRELSVCQPMGVASLLVGKSVKQPINGFFANRSSRRSIDEFGFKRALDLLVEFSKIAKSRGELKIEYKGVTRFGGRPVWLIRRILPYTDANRYPDRTTDILIDQEYHVPVAIYCYSDDAREPRNLLGKYEYRNVRFDTGLTDKDFEPATYGM